MKKILLLIVAVLLMSPAANIQANDNGLASTSDFGAESAAVLGPVDTYIGGPWLEFLFRGPGTLAEPCFGACVPSSGGNSVEVTTFPPWTFSLPFGGGTLTVTDAFLYGDTFDIFDFGGYIGSTSLVMQGGACGDDPAICFPDPLSSSGVFWMVPGFHSIDILTWLGPFGGGAAYFRVDQNAVFIDMDIKFCSNPNAFNTKKKGGFPVTIFGDADFDVLFIDRDTLQICTDEFGFSCTPAGLKTFSFFDRGRASDAGTDFCIEDVADQDGFLDLDAVFYAPQVTTLLGPVSKGDVVGPLYVVGYLYDGTPFLSQAVYDLGVDHLWIKN